MKSIDMYDYALLAEASYANLSNIEEEKYQEALENKGEGLSKAQAKALLNDWDVVAHYEDKGSIITIGESGFSATLFQNKNTKEYVLANRGTAGGQDLIVSDGMDIATDGLAMDQVIDMYNFWQKIVTKSGDTYQAAVLETNAELTLQYTFGLISAEEIQNMGYLIDSPSGRVREILFRDSRYVYPGDHQQFGLGIPVDKVTVTGHSLGGHLSAAFSRIFPEITNESIMINGAGFAQTGLSGLSGNGAGNIKNLFKDLNPNDKGFNKDIITNLTGDKGIDFVAQDWYLALSQPGKQPELFIESGTSHTFGHGSPQMTNTLAVMNLFFLIDKELAEKPIEESLIFLNQLFKAMAFNDDITLENIVVALTKIFLKDEITIKETDRDGLYSAINKFFDSNNNFKFSGDYSIKFLVDQSSNSIVGLAQNNLAYTYALVHGNIFAIEGLDYSSFNQNGELEHYNPDTQKGSLTDRYLKDRATYIQALIEYNTGKNISDVKFTYEDLSANEKLPILTLAPNRIVFASNEGGEIKRQALGHQNWSIYGGKGVDEIEFVSDSTNSHHYIEGGYGGDVYTLGGASNIEVFDIEGNDKYTIASKGETTINDERGTDKYIIGEPGILWGGSKFSGKLVVNDKAGRDQYEINYGTDKDSKIEIFDTGVNGVVGDEGKDTYIAKDINGELYIEDIAGNDNYKITGEDSIYGAVTIKDLDGNDRYDFTNYAGHFSIYDFKGDDTYTLGGASTIGNYMSIVDEGGNDTYNFVFTKEGFSKGTYRITDKDGQGTIVYNGRTVKLDDPEQWQVIEDKTGLQREIWAYDKEWLFTYDSNNKQLVITSYHDYINPSANNLKPTIIVTDFYSGKLGIDSLDWLENEMTISYSRENSFEQQEQKIALRAFAQSQNKDKILNDVFKGNHKTFYIHFKKPVKEGDIVEFSFSDLPEGAVILIGSKKYTVRDGVVQYSIEDYRKSLEVSVDASDVKDSQTFSISATLGNSSVSANYDLINREMKVPENTGKGLGNSDKLFDYVQMNEFLTSVSTGGRGDVIHGHDGQDIAWAGAGNDLLMGYGGDDQLFGEAGSDILIGDTLGSTKVGGNDLLVGGDGKDIIIAGGGNDMLHAGNIGDHKLTESKEQDGDFLVGGYGDDYLYGSTENDFLNGGAGEDIIYGGAGNDIILGDGNYSPAFTAMTQFEPNTMESFSWTADADGKIIFQKNPNITLYAYTNFNWSIKYDHEKGSFLLDGKGPTSSAGLTSYEHIAQKEENISYNDVIYGGAGNDYIAGQIGDDTIYGGEGDDVIYGDDEFYSSSEIDGNDVIYGGTGADRIYGGGGNDYLNAGELSETFEQGRLDTAQDKLYGGEGNDILIANGGGDLLYGGTGNDILYASDHAKLYGEDDDDHLFGLDSKEAYLDGGKGHDTFYAGTSKNSEYHGGEGNDIFYAQKASDIVLSGGEDDDTLYSGNGSNVILDGGTGHDTYILDQETFAKGSNTIIKDSDGDWAIRIAGMDLTAEYVEYTKEGDRVFYTSDKAYQLKVVGKDLVISSTNPNIKGTVLIVDGTTHPTYLNFLEDTHAPEVKDTQSDLTLNEKDDWSYILSKNLFTHLGGDQLTYKVTLADGSALPSWVTFNPQSLTLSGNADNDDVGSLRFKVTATDSKGRSAAQNFGVTINNVNDAPESVGSLQNVEVKAGDQLTWALPQGSFVDADIKHGDKLSYEFKMADGSVLPNWLQYNVTSGALSGVPPKDFKGDLQFKVVAKDLKGATAEHSLNISIIGGSGGSNHTPVINDVQSDLSLNEKDIWSYELSSMLFTDPDGDKLSYKVTLADGSALPLWLVFDPVTMTLSGKAGNDDVGSLNLKITATDPSGLNVEQSFNITVNNVNDAPFVSGVISNISSKEGDLFSWVMPNGLFSDIDAIHGDSLNYSVTLTDGSMLPDWLTFNSITGVLSGTPPKGSFGDLQLKVIATDKEGASADIYFSIQIEKLIIPNQSPVIGEIQSNLSLDEQVDWSYQLSGSLFTDPDGDKLSYRVTLADGSALPSWLVFNSETLTLSGNAGNDDVGALNLKVIAIDPSGLSAEQSFTVTINRVNDGPVAAPDAFTTKEHDKVAILDVSQLLANDFDLNPQDTLSVTGVYDSKLGVKVRLENGKIIYDHESISKHLSYGEKLVDTFTYQITDSRGASTTSTVTMTIEGQNNTPEIGNKLPNATVLETTPFIYQIPKGAFVDTDSKDQLTFVAFVAGNKPLPDWLTFDTNKGLFYGIPPFDEAVGVLSIGIIAYDKHGAAVTQNFSVQINSLATLPHAIIGTDKSEVLYDKKNKDGDNLIYGLGGNDTIKGYDGNDFLAGGAGNDLIYGGKGDDTINGGEGNDTLYGEDGNDTIYGGEGDDRIHGGDGNDTLYGGAGDDRIYGDNGDDILIGGKGNDRLEGEKGNDTYRLSKGDGVDEIVNYASDGDQTTDILEFTNVNQNEVFYRQDKKDLIIEYGQGDSVKLRDFFKGGRYAVNEIHFADGTVVKENEVPYLMHTQSNQSLARTMSMDNEPTRITVNQELHSLISAMASFDSGNSANDDFMVTDQSLSRPMLTTSSY